MATQIKKKYPLASKYLGKVRTIFEEFDKDKDDKLTLNECAAMFQTLSKKVTSLPAVSQLWKRSLIVDRSSCKPARKVPRKNVQETRQELASSQGQWCEGFERRSILRAFQLHTLGQFGLHW